MKKLISISLLLLTFSFGSFAQRFAYVDTDYILAHIPEYNAALEKIDNISRKWQKEIETKIAKVDQMYKDYQVEKILLSAEMRAQREKAIIEAEKGVKALQKKRFGKKGDLFKKQEQLLKPIQDKVYQSIVDISEEERYGMVFDKAGSTTVLYSLPRFDISDDVIEALGYEPGALEYYGEEEDPIKGNNSDGGNQKRTGSMSKQ